MAVTTFAAINIGSSELSMKIFEVTKKTGIQELTHVRHKLLLGAETYTNGCIMHKTTEEICQVLEGYKQIMHEYGTSAYNAYATSALREASNNLSIIDQIRTQTGIKIKIISNSEQRFLRYKAIALKESLFSKMIDEGTLIADIGAGSIQLSLFENGCLRFTQNLKLGNDRILELLGSLEAEAYNYTDLVTEYIDKDLSAFSKILLPSTSVKNIIAVGDHIHDILLTAQSKKLESRLISAVDFGKLKFSIHKHGQIYPTIILLRRLLALAGSDSIYLSTIDLCDSIVAEYAEQKEKIIPEHNFTRDIVTSATELATKYCVSSTHMENVQYLALELFDRMKKIHGLSKRSRLLLQIGCILHSVGAFISINDARENSYKIIMSSEIIGLSHTERVQIANMVRYYEIPFPRYQLLASEFTKDEYLCAVKLGEILNLANVLDKSAHQKIQKVRISCKDDILLIVADTLEDITLEKGFFQREKDSFENIFGVKPKLRIKRGIKHG